MVSDNFGLRRPDGSPRINVNPEPSQPFVMYEPERTIEDVMPDVVQTDMGNDPCCGEAREMWRDGLAEGWGDDHYTNDPEGGLHILEMYDAMSCAEFRQSLENRFDAQGYSLMGGGSSQQRSFTRPGMNPHSPRSNHSWEDSLANRVLEAWDKCSEASLPTGEASQDMGFYASEDAFEAGWNAILKYSEDDSPFEGLVTLFSGMGAPETAAMRVGAKPVLAMDGWDESIRTLNENLPGKHIQQWFSPETLDDTLGHIHDATTGLDSWALHQSPSCKKIARSNQSKDVDASGAMEGMRFADDIMSEVMGWENAPVVMSVEQSPEILQHLLRDKNISQEFKTMARESPLLESGMFGSPTIRQRMYAVHGSKATPQIMGRGNYRSINDHFPYMQQEWEEGDRQAQIDYLLQQGNAPNAMDLLSSPTLSMGGSINPGRGGSPWNDEKRGFAWKHINPLSGPSESVTHHRPALTHVRKLTRPEVMQIQGWTPEEAKAFNFPQRDNQGFQVNPPKKKRQNIIDTQLGNTLNPNIMENIFRNVQPRRVA